MKYKNTLRFCVALGMSALLGSPAFALDFSNFGNAPQLYVQSSLCSSTEATALTRLEPANMTLSSTVLSAYLPIFNGADSTFVIASTKTSGLAMQFPLYFTDMMMANSIGGAVSFSDLISSASALYTLSCHKADMVSPSAINAASPQQLAALLAGGLSNPKSFNSISLAALQGVATLTAYSSNNTSDTLSLSSYLSSNAQASSLIAMIPKAVRNSFITGGWSTNAGITGNPGWYR